MESLPEIRLPPGIRSRFVENINGLRMHVLEAGFETKGRPCLLLLHGFPELAFSWRKVMGPLADAGYHVIAPDQRGYGRTTGWNASYEAIWRHSACSTSCATRSGWYRRSATQVWTR
jgi:pimeloyl-ACP methyl ester carboxylesterase